MDQSKLINLINRMRKVAIKSGCHSDDVEDIAQAYAVKMLDNKRQTPDQFLIDHIRKAMGRDGMKGHLHYQGSFEPSVETLAEYKVNCNMYAQHLDGDKRTVFILSVKWGLTHKEIAEVLNVSSYDILTIQKDLGILV